MDANQDPEILFFNRIWSVHVNEARKIDQSWRPGFDVRNDAIREPAEAFWSNLDRIDAMASLPFTLTSHAIWSDRLTNTAEIKTYLDGLVSGTRPDPVESIWSNLFRATAGLQQAVEFPPAAKVERLIDLLLGLRWNYVSSGFHALLGSQLVMAWMAFESLAADLWVAAVNARPRSLAVNVLSASTQDTAPKDDPTPQQERQYEISLNVDALKLAQFNLVEKMGDILKDRKRVSFLSLDGIEKAYLAAFRSPPGQKNARPSHNLTDLLDEYRQRLFTLSKMRHLLAHKGGVLDKKFIDEVKSHSPELTSSPDGRLPLSGPMVRDYTNAAFRAGGDLIKFVDNWLATVPDQIDG